MRLLSNLFAGLRWSPVALAVALALSAIGGAAGCGGSPSPGGGAPVAAPAPAGPPSVTPTAAGLATAREIFATRCSVCHGTSGRGDGPASAGLTPRPRDYTDPAWQAGVTDIHIERIVQFGGAAVGKSPAMPANPDLIGKTDVVAGLRTVVREFRRP